MLLLPAALAACTAPVAVAPGGDLRARQEAACRAAIAAHVSRPEDQVAPRWLSDTQGVATVQTMDGARRHLCRVDASARVLGYSHPDG
ncbi:hypothetical protein IT41_09570 [Paracoccus halophilus]|uniref:Lipoprotein n=1 Tax=Paracoccus halophilus TaxID=376733 RepID=A0A099F345_9RHOB|nr:hypothetical protein IT41_09570 [Paracoccus halophilus]